MPLALTRLRRSETNHFRLPPPASKATFPNKQMTLLPDNSFRETQINSVLVGFSLALFAMKREHNQAFGSISAYPLAKITIIWQPWNNPQATKSTPPSVLLRRRRQRGLGKLGSPAPPSCSEQAPTPFARRKGEKGHLFLSPPLCLYSSGKGKKGWVSPKKAGKARKGRDDK